MADTRAWLERFIILMLAAGLIHQVFRVNRENRNLRVAFAKAVGTYADAHVIQTKQVLPVLRGVTLSGEYRVLDLAAEPSDYLIITLSAGCPVTHSNLPKWKRMAHALQRQGIGVVWVFRDRLAEAAPLAAAQDLPGPVFVEVPYDVHRSFELSVVPQTVFARRGRVEAVWDGAIDESRALSDISYARRP